MGKFKVGDMVRCVDSEGIDVPFVLGESYRVVYVDPTDGMLDLNIDDTTGVGQWDDSRFELVEANEPTVSELGEMMGMDPLKELNNLTTHPTGAVREPKEGKGKQHYLLVGFPYTLTELAKHMENPLGRNWEQGLPVSSYADAALRHLIGFLSGDPEPHHLRAAIWNMMCMSETVHRVEIGTLPKEVDDVERERRSWMNGGGS